jgi:hypothetical protein
MTCLWDGQRSTVHGPRHIFLNFKRLFLLLLAKKRIITLIGRGGNGMIPSRSAAAHGRINEFVKLSLPWLSSLAKDKKNTSETPLRHCRVCGPK